MTEPAYPALDAEIASCDRCAGLARGSEIPAEVLRLIHVIGGHPTEPPAGQAKP